MVEKLCISDFETHTKPVTGIKDHPQAVIKDG